jgi:hypothetical protein
LIGHSSADSYQSGSAHIEKNRVNQRNFRARRQAYIQELEEQIRNLKDERLQATKEMQTAARLVLDENRKLRWFLEHDFGISKWQLDLYLSALEQGRESHSTIFKASQASSDSAVRHPKSKSPHLTFQEPAMSSNYFNVAPRENKLREPQISTLMPNTRSLREEAVASPSTQTRNFEVQISNSNSKTTPSRISVASGLQEDHVNSRSFDGGGSTPADGVQEPPRGPGTFSTSTEGKGDRSCEEAAMIIASLRGGEMSDEIFGELGCSSDKSCAVNNLSIFELLDRGQV